MFFFDSFFDNRSQQGYGPEIFRIVLIHIYAKRLVGNFPASDPNLLVIAIVGGQHRDKNTLADIENGSCY